MRLIDADFATYAAESEFDEEDTSKIRWLISHIPTVDAEPVRHGRWINPRLNKYGHPCHQCNQCLFVASQKDRNFCPDCGAKMDLKE